VTVTAEGKNLMPDGEILERLYAVSNCPGAVSHRRLILSAPPDATGVPPGYKLKTWRPSILVFLAVYFTDPA
jgi:hypothetical protein